MKCPVSEAEIEYDRSNSHVEIERDPDEGREDDLMGSFIGQCVAIHNAYCDNNNLQAAKVIK